VGQLEKNRQVNGVDCLMAEAYTSSSMQKRSSINKHADDGKNPAAVALGRLGGLKGGKARATKLSAEKRSEIAKKAAEARWHKGD